MPCGDSRDDAHYYTEKVRLLTRIACESLTELERLGAPIPACAAQWWADHKERDRIRDEREKERESMVAKKRTALSKLTPEEREAILARL